MPFHSSSVWSHSAPRTKTEVCWPGGPAMATVTPGTEATRSPSDGACRASISSASMTATETGTSARSSVTAEAVTTTSSPKRDGVGGETSGCETAGGETSGEGAPSWSCC